MVHLESAYKWRVCFNNNVVLFAELGNVGTRVEWMDLDLVDSRQYARFGFNQLLQLCSC